VADIAKALIGERDIPTRIMGIRPGEKLHEILISEEEMRHVQERGHYYAISSMLPEIATTPVASTHGSEVEYSSRTSVGDYEATRTLLSRHGLLDAAALEATSSDELLC